MRSLCAAFHTAVFSGRVRSLAVTCGSCAVACGRVRSRAVFRGLVDSCAVRCGRVRSSAVPCGRVRSCGPVRSCAVPCGRVRSSAVVCDRVRSCAITRSDLTKTAPVEERGSKARAKTPYAPNPDRCFVGPPPGWPTIAMPEGGDAGAHDSSMVPMCWTWGTPAKPGRGKTAPSLLRVCILIEYLNYFDLRVIT